VLAIVAIFDATAQGAFVALAIDPTRP